MCECVIYIYIWRERDRDRQREAEREREKVGTAIMESSMEAASKTKIQLPYDLAIP